MKKIRLKELFNIPNCLCYLRIILIPIFLHRYFLAGSKEDYYICATILIISGLSDFFRWLYCKTLPDDYMFWESYRSNR